MDTIQSLILERILKFADVESTKSLFCSCKYFNEKKLQINLFHVVAAQKGIFITNNLEDFNAMHRSRFKNILSAYLHGDIKYDRLRRRSVINKIETNDYVCKLFNTGKVSIMYRTKYRDFKLKIGYSGTYMDYVQIFKYEGYLFVVRKNGRIATWHCKNTRLSLLDMINRDNVGLLYSNRYGLTILYLDGTIYKVGYGYSGHYIRMERTEDVFSSITGEKINKTEFTTDMRNFKCIDLMCRPNADYCLFENGILAYSRNLGMVKQIYLPEKCQSFEFDDITLNVELESGKMMKLTEKGEPIIESIPYNGYNSSDSDVDNNHGVI